MKRLLVTAALFAATCSVQAAGVDDLRNFLNSTRSAVGQFEQRVMGERGEEKSQRAVGEFSFLRPGCFVWRYTDPFPEEMVSNGEKLWLYDKELEQVTVKKLTKALPATPASLLFGNNDFERDFIVENMKTDDGLQWVLALPRDENGAFAEVKLAFDAKSLPARMVLKDNFGQETHLHFTNVQKNATVSVKSFTFVVPKGVEVLEDRGGF